MLSAWGIWMAIVLGRYAIIIVIIVLVIKALMKYLRHRSTDDENKVEMEPDCQSLGETLKAYRIACNMTQELVAEKLGVSRQAVSKWENGVSEPSTSNLIALANLYGVSVDELLNAKKV